MRPDVKFGRMLYVGEEALLRVRSRIGDELCVLDYINGNWISGSEGSERSEPLSGPLLKRAKRALACARRQALRRS